MVYFEECVKCENFRYRHGDFIACQQPEYTLMVPVVKDEVACPCNKSDN